MKVGISILLLAVLAIGASAQQISENALLITVDELQSMIEDEEAYVVDVRDLMSYLRGHIPGAYAVPLSELPQKLSELADIEQTVVTYCACPAEETSLQAAFYLVANGVDNVRVLRGGIQGWSVSRDLVRGPRRF